MEKKKVANKALVDLVAVYKALTSFGEFAEDTNKWEFHGPHGEAAEAAYEAVIAAIKKVTELMVALDWEKLGSEAAAATA